MVSLWPAVVMHRTYIVLGQFRSTQQADLFAFRTRWGRHALRLPLTFFGMQPSLASRLLQDRSGRWSRLAALTCREALARSMAWQLLAPVPRTPAALLFRLSLPTGLGKLSRPQGQEPVAKILRCLSTRLFQDSSRHKAHQGRPLRSAETTLRTFPVVPLTAKPWPAVAMQLTSTARELCPPMPKQDRSAFRTR